jgi:hypothetical protein
MKNRIQMEWNKIVLVGDNNGAVDFTLPEFNPIRRVPVVVTGDHAAFILMLCLP